MATVSLNSAAGKWMMASAILASAMAFIDGTALNVILPSLQKSLHTDSAELFWILNAYLLMLASLILIGGAMGDKLGRKKVFMTGIFIFMTGSAACGFAGSGLSLLIFRLLQGIGGALMIPGSLSLISSAINDKERGKAIGTWSAFTTIVTMGGPVLGGALADAGLWRFIFFINIPIGIITLWMLWRYVKESKDEEDIQPLDFPGSIAIVFALALLTFGFLRIPVMGMVHPQVYGALAAGFLLLLVFIYIERSSKHPMMPLNLFSDATFSGANLLTFFLYAGLGTAMLFLSLNLVQVQGYSQLQSGLTFLPFTLLMVSFARFAGKLADKHGPRFFLICGPAIAGAGLLMLSFIGQTAGPAQYWTTFFPGILVFGLGMSVTVAPLTTAVMGSVPNHLSGTASGINNAVTRTASVFANAIFGALAVLLFSGALAQQVKSVPVTLKDKQAIMKQSVNLGDARPPAHLSISKQLLIKNIFHHSFITAYQQIIQLSAVLCFLAALMAVIFIKPLKRLAHSTKG